MKLSHASAASANTSRRAEASRQAPVMAAPPPAARVTEPVPGPVLEPQPERVMGPEPQGPSAAEMALELIERLDRIEERLAELTRPVRPIPATREVFAEWVRLRKWEEMAFGDFLRLRRSGVV